MARGKAWGNALGGWRKQRRGPNGQWGGSGAKKTAKTTRKTAKRTARSKHKSTVKRNNQSYRNRMRGSHKARVREVVKLQSPRAIPYVLGAAAFAVAGGSTVRARTSKSRGVRVSNQMMAGNASSLGAAFIAGGVAGSVYTTRNSMNRFEGLRQSQNAYSRYQKKSAVKAANLNYRNAKRQFAGKPLKASGNTLTATQWRARRDARNRRAQKALQTANHARILVQLLR